MMTFRKVLFSVAVLLLFATHLPAQESTVNTILVFGPRIFTGHDDRPTTESVSFALPPLDFGPFTLLAENSGVTVGNVELNGTSLFGPRVFDSQSVHGVVPLEANNTLKVELSGPVSASLTIMIVGYQYEYQYEYTGDDRNLPVAPSETTTVQALAWRQMAPSETTTVQSIDWRQKGAVTPIKNQGQCGSDWAFSATGALEGLVAIKFGALHNLSEQELIDCSRANGNYGCNGGAPAAAFQYTVQRGLDSQASYPYRARDGTCKLKTPPTAAPIATVIRIPVGDEQTLAARVAQQPVSVVLNGNWFREYRGGVANPKCESASPDFLAVLIVGFGEDNSTSPATPYWIVKNSLGTSWGESGYFRIVRGQNKCGIADFATLPQY